MATDTRRRRTVYTFDDEPEVSFNDFQSTESFERHRAHAKWFLENITNVTRFRHYGTHYRETRNLPRAAGPKRQPNIPLSRLRYAERLSALPDEDFDTFRTDRPIFLSEYSVSCTVERTTDPEGFARTLQQAKWCVGVLVKEIERRGGRVDGLTGAHVVESSFLTTIPEGAHRVYVGTHFSFWGKKKEKKKVTPPSYCVLASDIVYKSGAPEDEGDEDEEEKKEEEPRCPDGGVAGGATEEEPPTLIRRKRSTRRKRPRRSPTDTPDHHDVLVA